MYNYSPFEKLITCNQKTSRSVEKNSNYLYDNVHDNIKSPNDFKGATVNCFGIRRNSSELCFLFLLLKSFGDLILS